MCKTEIMCYIYTDKGAILQYYGQPTLFFDTLHPHHQAHICNLNNTTSLHASREPAATTQFVME